MRQIPINTLPHCHSLHVPSKAPHPTQNRRFLEYLASPSADRTIQDSPAGIVQLRAIPRNASPLMHFIAGPDMPALKSGAENHTENKRRCFNFCHYKFYAVFLRMFYAFGLPSFPKAWMIGWARCISE